jgi:hypothetical protein
VVRPSTPLPPRRVRLCVVCNGTHIFRHSRTNSAVSNPLSPLTVSRLLPGTSCNIPIAAYCSAVTVASHTRLHTINHCDSPPADSRCNSTLPPQLFLCAPEAHRGGSSMLASGRTLLVAEAHRGISRIIRRTPDHPNSATNQRNKML